MVNLDQPPVQFPPTRFLLLPHTVHVSILSKKTAMRAVSLLQVSMMQFFVQHAVLKNAWTFQILPTLAGNLPEFNGASETILQGS